MARFELNPAGVERVLSEPAAITAITRVAEDIARHWQRLDPRNAPGGHQPPTIQVGNTGRDAGIPFVPVVTNDSFWHLIEYGSANNQPYRPATKAVQDAGANFRDAR